MENEKKPTIIRLTKEFTFEAAHALEGYDGLCREIHGHSYRLFVTVKGTPCADESNPKFGMVMDFGELKRIVNEQILSRLDHAFVMRRTAESTRVAEQIGCRFGRATSRNGNIPTCWASRSTRKAAVSAAKFSPNTRPTVPKRRKISCLSVALCQACAGSHVHPDPRRSRATRPTT